MKITKSKLIKIIQEEVEQLTRDNIESHLLDAAKSMARDGVSYKGILMGLNDDFMDNFAGMGSDYADYEEFIKSIARQAAANRNDESQQDDLNVAAIVKEEVTKFMKKVNEGQSKEAQEWIKRGLLLMAAGEIEEEDIKALLTRTKERSGMNTRWRPRGGEVTPTGWFSEYR